MRNERMLCENCGWFGLSSSLRTAPNPWDPENVAILGCPNCLQVTDLHVACYRTGCTNRASIGTPTKAGYVVSCAVHAPKDQSPSGEGP